MARFFARPIHVAFWVDDLIFIMSTPEHSDCVGFKGGCAVCWEFYGRALKVQEMWVKARALNMPLSTKGQAVGRRGALAGLGIDTHRGRFHMLPEKLASMILGVHAHGNGEVRRRRSALWPVVPSSLYGAFLAGEQCDASNLGITFDTSVHGWAAGVEVVVGGYRIAVDLLGAASINPSALSDCGGAGVQGDARWLSGGGRGGWWSRGLWHARRFKTSCPCRSTRSRR